MSDTLIIAIIGVFAASFGGSGFWNWISERTRWKKEERVLTPYEKMTMAMGKDRLNMLCKKHLKNGYIPLDEYESFKDMGDAYITGGGNSMVKKLFEEAKELPVKDV